MSVIFTVIFATIFLAAFVLIAGLVMYLTKTIDHGEARFDSETGEPLGDELCDDEKADKH